MKVHALRFPGTHPAIGHTSTMGTVSRRDTLPVAALARMTAEAFARNRNLRGREMFAAELADAIEMALLTAVRTERRACAAACTRRGDLWQKTAEKADTPDVARTEAEHRSNEAIYLADAIVSRAYGHRGERAGSS